MITVITESKKFYFKNEKVPVKLLKDEIYKFIKKMPIFIVNKNLLTDDQVLIKDLVFENVLDFYFQSFEVVENFFELENAKNLINQIEISIEENDEVENKAICINEQSSCSDRSFKIGSLSTNLTKDDLNEILRLDRENLIKSFENQVLERLNSLESKIQEILKDYESHKEENKKLEIVNLENKKIEIVNKLENKEFLDRNVESKMFFSLFKLIFEKSKDFISKFLTLEIFKKILIYFYVILTSNFVLLAIMVSFHTLDYLARNMKIFKNSKFMKKDFILSIYMFIASFLFYNHKELLDKRG